MADDLGQDDMIGSPSDNSLSRTQFEDPLYNASENRKYLLAKTFFDCREYDRVGTALIDCSSNKCLFLKLYARYIVCFD